VGLVVEMTWKKHGDIGWAAEAMAEMATEWCLKSQMTEEHRSITAGLIETILESADALSHLCRVTDPRNGGAAEIDILGNVPAVARVIVGGSNTVLVCVYLH